MTLFLQWKSGTLHKVLPSPWMSCFAFSLSQTSRMGFKSHHLFAWGGSGTARTRALGDHACYSCCLWIFRRENATHTVHAAAINSQRRAASWGGPGACIGCLPWEVFQDCPPGRTSWDGLGTLGFIFCSAKHPCRTISMFSCDVHNSVYGNEQLWHSFQPVISLFSFQIPVACKSCPCGYVFISRKLLNAKLNERSSPAIAGRPLFSF